MSTSAPGASSSSRRQKRMGPAPFASFEDLSDELESPEDKNVAGSVVRLPGIREDLTPTTPAMTDRSPSPAYLNKGISLIGAPTSATVALSPGQPAKKNNIKPPATPRIDISRASSSSHHDSKDSSPEREIYEAHDPNTAKLGLGFKEDGALDLRSSTEELDFQDMTMERRRSSKVRPSSPSILEDRIATRKDSQCSDIVLLSISGRTSRLSSIGSQGSGQSRLSNASHISVLSGQSGLSRCSSPHKMLLETSFCGTKLSDAAAKVDQDQTGTKLESEDMEKILLSRKHDPTVAILAEGISVDKAQPLAPKSQPEKPARKKEVREKSDVTITVDKPESESNKPNTVKSRFVSESGVEYYYIPLKGPLPPDLPKPATGPQLSKPKLREVKSANDQSRTASTSKSKVPESKPRCKSVTPTPSPSITKKEEPKYIRIKLKPDKCYSEESPTQEIQKPDSLELDVIEKSSNYQESTNLDKIIGYVQNPDRIYPAAANGSPKIISDTTDSAENITPSPSVSRRSSFASLFKGKETVISPESPSAPSSCKKKSTMSGILKEAGDNLRNRSRSRSKSRDRESHKSSLSTAPSSTESIDSKSKHKSVLSLFKSGKKDKPKSESETSSQDTIRSSDGIGKLEFKFNEPKSTYYENPLDCATIRIPLHSPTYYENRNISEWKNSSQDSQETVIENVSRNADIVVEKVPQSEESVEKKTVQTNATSKPSRQSSTSSENIVFSTKLGNDNEVFTTKLPKKLPNENSNTEEPKRNEVVNGVADEIFKEERLETKGPQKPSRESSVEKISRLQDVEKTKKTKSITSIKELEMKLTENEVVKDKRISQISAGEISNISSALSSTAEDHNSSESEKDVEDNSKSKNDLKLDLDVSEPERKAIVLQQDSFEDELPYIPTTLPLERSAALPIVPIKQRSTYEIKTCPIERPRSTTPINPSCLDEYCEEVMGSFSTEKFTKTIEKLKISLPRNDSFDKTKVKSPRKKECNTNWFEFAEKGITRSTPSETPPPLPPKGLQKSWINFEDIPEKRKAPKRIQTLPSRSYIEVPESISVDKAQPLAPKSQPEKPARKKEVREKSDVTITVDKPESESNKPNTVKSRFVSESGVEYYYIPLKGPLPPDLPKPATGPQLSKPKLREVKSANDQSRTASTSKSKVPESKPRCKSVTPTPSPSITKKEEPKYIRIKLKPDKCYSEESPTQEIQKPDSLELDVIEKSSNYQESTNLDKIIGYVQNPDRIYPAAANGSPKIISDTTDSAENITPSPSVSRRSSFASLFKGKETVISPESPSAPSSCKKKSTMSGILKEAGDNLRNRSRSRSKSRDRESHKSSLSTAPSSTESIDSKSKHKSVLSLFKSGKKDKPKSESETSSQDTIRSSDGIGKLEFKFNEPKSTYYENPLDCATIRIPLHSPTYYENRNISEWKNSSQDSQETVIENVSRNADIVVEKVPQSEESVEKKTVQTNATSKPSRQSSTSSENIVFSTKLGNDNEVFTTKLPKKLPNENSNTEEPKRNEVVNGVADEIFKEERLETKGPQKPSRESSVEKISRLQDVEKTKKTKSITSIKELEMKLTENEVVKDKRISQISAGEISNISSALSSTAEDHNSSESEKDVEDNSKSKNDLKLDLDVSEPERKAIVLQQDSFEDELPYIPTTLPLERSAALPIVPIKQRSTYEIKTCPIERPRSTTPINPSCLDEYCEEVMGSFSTEKFTKTIEKLKISLPRNDSFDKTKVKSPRKKECNTNWFEFAEKGITRSTPSETPPPLPPKGLQKSWINFEDIPEKRKAPKRIQTLPSRSYIEVPESVLQESVVYNYVNPDECKCECHELNAKERERRAKESQEAVQEDEMPLLEDENTEDDKIVPDRVKLDVAVSDCRSIISDSSVDLSTSIDPHEASGTELTLQTPFTSDLGLSSNRSSFVSQDDHQSPESPNAFPKIS